MVLFLPIALSVQMSFLETNMCESWAQSIVASGNKEGPRVGNLRLKIAANDNQLQYNPADNTNYVTNSSRLGPIVGKCFFLIISIVDGLPSRPERMITLDTQESVVVKYVFSQLD